MVGFGLNSCKQMPTSFRLEDVVCVELDVRRDAINDSDSIARRISRYIGVEKKDVVVHLQAPNGFFFFFWLRYMETTKFRVYRVNIDPLIRSTLDLINQFLKSFFQPAYFYSNDKVKRQTRQVQLVISIYQ